MRRAHIQPRTRIGSIYAAADLQSAGICRQCFPRRSFISGTEHDDVTTGQTVAFVEFCEPRCGAFGDKVGAHGSGVVTQRAADDLDNLAIPEINARTKHAAKLEFARMSSKFQVLRG